MDILLLWAGRVAGLVGVGLCACSVYTRLNGAYFAGGFQTGTLLQAGGTALLVACFCLLLILTRSSRR